MELEMQPEDREPIFAVYFGDDDDAAAVVTSLLQTVPLTARQSEPILSAYRHYLVDVPDSETGWELITAAVVAAGFDVYNGTEWFEIYGGRDIVTTSWYRVRGTAHGTYFDEWGFSSADDAQAYASSIIDGDTGATVEVIPTAVRGADIR